MCCTQIYTTRHYPDVHSFGSYPVPMSHEICSRQEVATQAVTATASRFGHGESGDDGPGGS